MQRVPSPPVILALAPIGVELEYSFFSGAGPDRFDRLLAIDAHLSAANSLQQWHLPDEAVDVLQSIEEKQLTREAFLGDWCDPRDLMLIKRGSGDVEGLGQVTDIRFDQIGEKRIRSWGGWIPDFAASGQYAYAFSCPPYSLEGPRANIQRLFKDSTEQFLSRSPENEIFDWSHGPLDRVHSLFAAGMEWWGVFLFTVRNPIDGSMVVISGSATD